MEGWGGEAHYGGCLMCESADGEAPEDSHNSSLRPHRSRSLYSRGRRSINASIEGQRVACHTRRRRVAESHSCHRCPQMTGRLW